MLRKYQQDMYDAIRHNLLLYKNVCAVLPCRSGKSFIMKEICEKAENSWEKVCVAMGIADYDPEQDYSVNDTVRRADRLMYENKRQRKVHRS